MNPFVARSVMRGLINGRSYCGSSINNGRRYSPAIVGRGVQFSGQQNGVLFGWRRMMSCAPASVTKAPLEKEERKENPATEEKNGKEKMLAIFETWCDRYGKKYSSEKEKNYRLKIFEKNYTYVTRNNMVNPYYEMGVNGFSDLKDSERKVYRARGRRISDKLKKFKDEGVVKDEGVSDDEDPLLRSALNACKDFNLTDDEFKAKFGSLFARAYSNHRDINLIP